MHENFVRVSKQGCIWLITYCVSWEQHPPPGRPLSSVAASSPPPPQLSPPTFSSAAQPSPHSSSPPPTTYGSFSPSAPPWTPSSCCLLSWTLFWWDLYAWLKTMEGIITKITQKRTIYFLGVEHSWLGSNGQVLNIGINHVKVVVTLICGIIWPVHEQSF